MIVENENMLRNEGEFKTPLFTLNCGSIHVITWIFIQSIWSQKKIFNFEIKNWGSKLNIVITGWTNPQWLLK